MKTLVTGAGGFIGSHLAEDQLRQGHEVVAMDLDLGRISHLRTHPECTLVEGDIRDRDLLHQIVPGTDCIFHLASAHLEVNKSESHYRNVNVGAVKALLDIAADSSVGRFVHCSSVGVYGRLRRVPADEETECRPDIVYEKTKLAGENEVLRFHRENGLPVVVLRPAWVYGPRCPRTAKLFRTIKKGRFVMVGRGGNFRHPIFISDMLAAFTLAATSETAVGEVFVIASSEAVSIKELVTEIAKVQHVAPPKIRVPLPLMKVLAGGVEAIYARRGINPPFSRRSLKFFTDHAAYDTSKSQKILDFQASVDLRQGLHLTNKWLLENGQ